MAYQVRKADRRDLDKVTVMFQQAIRAMIANGIDQWDDLYPDREVLSDDIEQQQLYLLADRDDIFAAFVINRKCDEQYKAGCWAYDGSGAAVLHRLCVNPKFQSKGLGKQTVVLIENMLLEEGYTSLRLDAFSGNPIALRMYESLHYEKVGEASFRKGLFYLYEKPLVRAE
ncbi:MAG: GNAT family N-acetyltransferase [Christensenellales bacterium]